MVDRKLVADGILEALERADRELRVKYRQKFRQVDRIKRQPSWQPFATATDTARNPITGSGYAVFECAWCGDEFVADPRTSRRPSPRFCDRACAGQMRRYRQRRRP